MCIYTYNYMCVCVFSYTHNIEWGMPCGVGCCSPPDLIWWLQFRYHRYLISLSRLGEYDGNSAKGCTWSMMACKLMIALHVSRHRLIENIDIAFLHLSLALEIHWVFYNYDRFAGGYNIYIYIYVYYNSAFPYNPTYS